MKLLFVCSPNNPTGNAMDINVLTTICNEFRGIVFIDEAYADFCTKKSLLEQLKDFPRLIVCRTLSKAHALAGARIGIACACSEIIGYFNKVKPPYNVSQLNQEAALTAINNDREFRKQRNEIINGRKRLAKILQQLKIVKKVWSSDANFLLVEFENAELVYKYLSQNGIITRNRSTIISNCLRITIGTQEENKKLISTLIKFEL